MTPVVSALADRAEITGLVSRLSEISLRNTWRTGSGYAAMLATG